MVLAMQIFVQSATIVVERAWSLQFGRFHVAERLIE